MEKNIEKLKFPIGKYKAILEFNFSRTVEDGFMPKTKLYQKKTLKRNTLSRFLI